MKTTIKILFTILLLLSLSCKEKNIISSGTDNSQGSVSLTIDKTDAPSDVISVIAYLTRENFKTFAGYLNLLSDSTADISFQKVAAGTWHLKVDALNKDSVVIYSGESDLKVQENVLTQVNLTLYPIGNGTGEVYIHVTWGNQNSWIDYNYNPIFTPSDNPSYPVSVSTSKVLYDNEIFKMWYLCTYNSGKGNVWYAESKDGLNWQNKFDEPIFVNGMNSKWDGYTVGPGTILKENSNNYKMYYNGWNDQYGQWQVGLATSIDGIHWERYSDPVLKADSLNEFKVGATSVIKINDLYYMFYGSSSIYNYNYMRINLATSSDGINWEKYSGNPIISPTEPWEGIGVTFPAVIYDNNRFVMVYSSVDRTKFGIAYSDDGKTWVKNSNYTLSNQTTNTKWIQINYPFLVKVGNEYRLYYTGTSPNGTVEICLTKSFTL